MNNPPSLSDKTRVIVCGDSGVGKAQNLICGEKVIPSPASTTGCNLEVKIVDYNEKLYFIEIVDVGGKQKHENSRNVFYNHVNGLILVHDLSNKNSYNKLKLWIAEVLEKINGSNSMKWKNVTEDMEEGGADLLELQVDGGYLPVLIIGNKVDLVEKNPLQKHQMHLAETGRGSVYVNSLDAKTLAPGSQAHTRLNAFFHQVIQRRYSQKSSSDTRPHSGSWSSPYGRSKGKSHDMEFKDSDLTEVTLDYKQD